jgi:hypothetical protein
MTKRINATIGGRSWDRKFFSRALNQMAIRRPGRVNGSGPRVSTIEKPLWNSGSEN